MAAKKHALRKERQSGRASGRKPRYARLYDADSTNLHALNLEREALREPVLPPTASTFEIVFVTAAGEAVITYTCHGNSMFSEMAQAAAYEYLGDRVWLHFPSAISFLHGARILPIDDTPYVKVLADLGICENSVITVVLGAPSS